MAHQIWTENFEQCPRCDNSKVRLATYHFGATYRAECSNCAFGKIDGDSQEMALARLRGQYLATNQPLDSDAGKAQVS